MDIYDSICSRCMYYDKKNIKCVRPIDMILAMEGCAIDDHNNEVLKNMYFEFGDQLGWR